MDDKPLVTTLDSVATAYKKGLIDAAQVTCPQCRRSRPRICQFGAHHANGDCRAHRIIKLLEDAGGWQADWPTHDSVDW